MHIVFLAPESKDREMLEGYRHLIDEIKSFKHVVFDGTFPLEHANHESHASTLTREIKKADAIIVEATESNFNLGRFITLAIQQHKPVLMLQKELKSTPLVIGTSRLVSVKQYKDLKKDSQQLLKTYFLQAKKQRLTYRFNLMLNRDINVYLMDRAQSQGLSKADYIRELIIHDMDTTE